MFIILKVINIDRKKKYKNQAITELLELHFYLTITNLSNLFLFNIFNKLIHILYFTQMNFQVVFVIVH